MVSLPLAGLVAHMASREANEEFARAQREAVRLVEQADRDFADWIDTAQNAAEIVATATRNPTLDIAACDRFVEGVRSHYAWVTTMFVADVNGHKLCASAGDDKSYNLLDREWFHQTVETRQRTLSNFLIGPVSQRPQITVGVPQLGANGEVARVVGVGIDLAAFNEHLAALRRDADATFTILDDVGTVLARHPDPDGLVGRSVADREIARTMLERRHGSGEFIGGAGQSRFYAYQPFNGTSATVAAGVARQPIADRIQAQLVRDLLTLAGVVVAAIIVGQLAVGAILPLTTRPAETAPTKPQPAERPAGATTSITAARLRVGTAGAALALAALGMAGYATGHLPLLGGFSATPSMMPHTMIGVVLAAGALLLAAPDAGPGRRRAVQLLALALVLRSLVNLVGLAFAIDLHPAWLFAPAPANPVALGSAGLALALGTSHRRTLQLFAGAFRFVAVASAYVGLIAYFYSADTAASPLAFRTLTLPTALALSLLSLGIYASQPGRGIVSIMTGDRSGALLTRRLIPAALLVPLAVGWTVAQLLSSGLLGASLSIAAFALFTMIVFAGLIAVTALMLNRFEDRLRSARDQLAEANATLEQRVIASTAEAADAALEARANEARYRLLADNATDIVSLLDFEFRPIYVSPALSDILGYTELELRKLDLDIVHPDDRRNHAKAYKALAAGEPHATLLHRVRHRDDRWIWLESLINRVADDDGTGAAYVSTARDVSLRMEAEQAMRDAKTEAERANQVKSQFLASMSHEIRTPMNGVLGFADLLLDSDLTRDQRRQVSLLRDAGQSLLAIINDILDISRIEAGKLQLERIAISPAAIVDAAVSLVRRQVAEKGLDISATVARDVPAWILTDPTRLRQIILNLLSNAVKFTDSGSISVVMRCEQGDGRRLLRCEVADTGVGISEEAQGRLFRDFSQVDATTTRRYGGTGLGLSICRRLAEAMGGSIGVQSAPGAGSRFWFTIGLEEAEGAPVEPTGDAPPVFQLAAASAAILVAEDLHINQVIVKAMLSAAGHDVTIVTNGAEAVEAVTQKHFDLVLMDIEMPLMDGIAATAAIRAMPGTVRDIPIIALTANAMLDEVDRCKAVGMNDHLAKPIEREKLLRLVGRWSGQRLAAE